MILYTTLLRYSLEMTFMVCHFDRIRQLTDEGEILNDTILKLFFLKSGFFYHIIT